MLCRMLIVDTLREGVYLPYTEVKSQRRPRRRASGTKRR
ncbi:hypothetical protein JOH52_002053 [Sinorhizobium meliloti]|nr:hypothetical protein [Sinorhizobium meliloti]